MKAGPHIVAGLAAAAAMVALFAARPEVLDRAELLLLDTRFRARGPVEPSAPIAVVAIDARSIDELGRWPWPRSVMARLIDRLGEAEVAVIGLDIVFSEPEVDPENALVFEAREALRAAPDGDAARARALLDRALELADTDGLLERAIERSDRTVLGYFFRTGEEDGYDETSALPLEVALDSLRGSRVAVARLPANERAPILTCVAAEPNLARFHHVARRSGFFSAARDADGVFRRASLVARCGGELYVSLELAMLEVLAGRRATVLGDADGIREVRIADSSFPTDEGGRILIDYRGPPGTFPTYPAVDVLRGAVGRDELRNHLVLVGATETGIGDVLPTPFGPVFPGVEVHANALDDLLSGDVLRRDDSMVEVELAAIVAIGLLVTFAVPRVGGATKGAVLALAIGLAYAGGAFYLFAGRGLWLGMAYPLLTLLAVYLVVAALHAMTVEAQGRRIRRQFATYVPPEVVEEMVRRPESYRLGGERRELAMLFSDVRGFTTLSESIGPENTSRLLNAYLTPMSQIVFDSRGTLDKYIGDAIVAFWGAPISVDAAPVRACAAAVDMQAELARLRRERTDIAGMAQLRTGVGLHVAEVVVGNFGSELRRDYTMTGDGVNLCARIEGLTKYYGVGILATKDLVDRLPGEFVVREIDRVRALGRSEVTTIFEVIGRGHPGDDERARLTAWAEALAAFREGRFRDAERIVEESPGLRDDPASAFLLERVRRHDLEPPKDWDGVWTFESK